MYFSDDISLSIQKSQVIIIAVGTPQTSNGDANMEYVNSVVRAINQNLKETKSISLSLWDEEKKNTLKIIYNEICNFWKK